ncbi:MAG: CPBP family intramembrane glutamic endopeptidase [Chloroflexota bacterium]
MDLLTSTFIWLNLTRLAILGLTGLLAWVTYRSHLILKEFQPNFNLLLSPLESTGRVLLVGLCLFLAWLSGLPPAQLGLVVVDPGRQVMVGVGVGLVTVVVINRLTMWSINRFGRDIYSPVLIQNILPRRPVEWPLVVIAFLPAVAMEELLFRALWLGSFEGLIPASMLILGTSIIFGLMHQPQGKLGMLLAGLINVLFSILFVWLGQLLLPLTAHYTVNVVQLVIAHFQRRWLESY